MDLTPWNAFRSGEADRWLDIAPPHGLLDSQCRTLAREAPAEALSFFEEEFWPLISSSEVALQINAHHWPDIQASPDDPPADCPALHGKLKGLAASAAAAHAHHHRQLEKMEHWSRQAVSALGSHWNGTEIDWTNSLTGETYELLRQIPVVGVQTELWVRYWLDKPFPTGPISRVPIVCTTSSGAHVCHLELAKLPDFAKQLAQHPDSALQPFGKSFLTAIGRQFDQHAICGLVWRLLRPIGLDFDTSLHGKSCEAAVAAGIKLLMAAKVHDPLCAVLAVVGGDGATLEDVFDLERKLRKLESEGFRRAIIADTSSFTYPEVRGLKVLRARTVTEAAEWAEAKAPRAGVAAIARPKSQPQSVVVPVWASFSPGQEPSARVSSRDAELEGCANKTVQFAGTYMCRFPETSQIRLLFERKHWGTNRPFARVLFQIPEGAFVSLVSFEPAFLLAYLMEFLRGIFIGELGLPPSFPQALLIVAAGYRGDSQTIVAEPGGPEAVRQFPLPPGAKVLCAEESLQEFTLNVPSLRNTSPVRTPEDFVQDLFLAALQDTLCPEILGHLRENMFKAVEAVLEQEQAKRDEELLDLGEVAAEMEMEYTCRRHDAERAVLEHLFEEVKQRAADPGIPQLSDVEIMERSDQALEEEKERLDAEFEQRRATIYNRPPKPNWDTLSEPEREIARKWIEEEAENQRRCHRFYRKAAMWIHPDLAVEAERPLHDKWFPIFLEKKTDMVMMEGIYGALRPSGGAVPFGNPVEEIERWIDRLVGLQETRRKLLARARDIERTRRRTRNEIEAWKSNSMRMFELRENMAKEEARQLRILLSRYWRKTNPNGE